MKKIVYVIQSLASKGGAERIISDKASYLADHLGYDVYIVTCHQLPQWHPNTYPLSPKVHQVNLGINYFSQYKVGYPRRLWVKLRLRRQLEKLLRATVQRIAPDVLVCTSYFGADVVCGIRCRAKKVVEAHEARLFTLRLDGERKELAVNVFIRLYRWYYFRKVEKKADVVVTLTDSDARLWGKARRVEVIPNFSVLPVTAVSKVEGKRVLAIGRLDWQKGYDMMLKAWAMVERRHPDWRLDIFGEGPMEQDIWNWIRDYGLMNVAIHRFTSDISREYANSSIVVLSSRFEGFSLVLLEAMRHGVPGVSFDCPFGPSEVMEDGKSGFLVPEGDTEAFAGKVKALIEDDTLRHQFAEAALRRAAHFDADVIMQRWNKLFCGG